MSIRMRCLLALIALLACVTVVAAQSAPQTPTTPAQDAVAQSPQAAPPAQPAKDVQTYTLPPEKYEKAVAYSRAKYTLYFVNFVYGLLVLLGVLAWRVAPKFRAWAEGGSQRRFLQVLIFAPLLQVVLSLLNLPLDIYSQWLALRYEQSIQGWGSWAWDWTKGLLISLILGTFLIWILYGVIRRSPRRWWFYFWLATLPIIVFLLFVTPVLIDPLFFQFKPLEAKQPQLVAEIEKVVAHGGLTIPRERMFEMNASTKLKSVSAYVTGIGASKRVVIWDTTLARMTSSQTLFVFGHEMGHYVLLHIPRTIAFLAILLLLFFYLGYRGMDAMLARWGGHWGIRGPDDWASLPVFLLLLSVFVFLASPVINTYSRNQEHDADIYGLEVIHGIVPDSPLVAAQSFQILGEITLADPDPHPFIKIWLYSHPPVAERVAFSRTYDPWARGEQPKFVK